MFLFQRSELGIMRRRYFGHSPAERRLAAHSSDLAIAAPGSGLLVPIGRGPRWRQSVSPVVAEAPAADRCVQLSRVDQLDRLHRRVELRKHHPAVHLLGEHVQLRWHAGAPSVRGDAFGA